MFCYTGEAARGGALRTTACCRMPHAACTQPLRSVLWLQGQLRHFLTQRLPSRRPSNPAGLTPEQVDRLTAEHHIYLTRNGRIS